MLDPLPDHEVAELLESQLGGVEWKVELIARSSNFVYRCTGASGAVAVRVPCMESDAPPSFWRQMREIFGVAFPPPPERFMLVSNSITAAGLSAPRLLKSVSWESVRSVLITTWIPGAVWEPDRLPASAEIHRRLGRFLGTMHEQSHPGYGPPGGPLRPPESYFETALASAVHTVEASRGSGAERLIGAMAACRPEAVAGSFAMVMPDISGNQFVFDEASLVGVVDLDSYVIGPIELELTIAEWCLVDHSAFADGYRSVRRLPRFAPFRDFHRASMLVNEPVRAEDVGRLLSENAVFD